MDKVASDTDVQRVSNHPTPKPVRVDAAGIDRRVFTLPREVSNREKRVGEVSRGHSSWSNEPA